MNKKRRKRVQKQKPGVLQLTRNPFDKDPFRKKQQIAVTGGEESLGAPNTRLKTTDILKRLEKMQKQNKPRENSA